MERRPTATTPAEPRRLQLAEAEAAETKDLLRALAESRKHAQAARSASARTRANTPSADSPRTCSTSPTICAAHCPARRTKANGTSARAISWSGVAATERELLAASGAARPQAHRPQGERFDHNFHQAMFEMDNTGQPAGTIVQVLQPGYVIHDRLLRPALVAVAKGG